MSGRDDYGSPGRTRTSDKVVNSHSLYQLSYRGMLGVFTRRKSVAKGLPGFQEVCALPRVAAGVGEGAATSRTSDILGLAVFRAGHEALQDFNRPRKGKDASRGPNL